MNKKIVKRKREHLEIASNRQTQYQEITNGFEHYHFIHNALPEMNLEDVDIATQFLGYPLKAPIIICSISGGEKEGEQLNKDLAVAANRSGIALAMGSLRPALEHPESLRSYQIARENAPDIPLVANLGATQIVQEYKTKQIEKILKQINVDALSIHLNPLQEALQPQGEPYFAGVSRAIEILRETLPYPVIVKEVGFGLSLDVIKRLHKIGIQWIDIAGAGGTSWSRIEHHRTEKETERAIAAQFFEWGIPTAESILEAAQIPQLKIIASGGINSGLKFAKAIALGAELAGAATPFLLARKKGGVGEICKLIDIYSETLRIAMFCTGCRNVMEFKGNRAIISYRKN